MCGIIGIHFKNPRDLGVGKENLEKFVDELLLGIEPRGRDATGLLTVDAKGKANLVKADIPASEFIKWRDGVPRRVRTILGHTRFATQGTPMNLDNNHPVQYGTCYAIHNGHISNDSELFSEHSLERNAEVDSEIIPALLHKHGLGENPTAALEQLDGGFAVAAVDPENYPDTTVLAKGWSSPVELYENNYAVVWASTTSALKGAVSAVFGFELPDRNIESLGVGEMLVMKGNVVTRMTFKPHVKTYTRTTTTYGNGYSSLSSSRQHNWQDDDLTVGDYSEVSDFMGEECEACLCERLYHGSGSNYSGRCNYVYAYKDSDGKEQSYSCRCEGFVSKKVDTRVYMEFCDGCRREFTVDTLTKVGTKMLCGICDDDPAVTGTVTLLKAADIRGRAEDVLTRQYAELEDTSDIDSAFAVREEAINEHVCAMASAKTGQEPAYINWLVNEMEKELPEVDETGYLAEAKSVAGKAYFTAWGALNDEIEEIEAAAFSVAQVANACNTESGGCLQGQSWCDGPNGNVFCSPCWDAKEMIDAEVIAVEDSESIAELVG